MKPNKKTPLRILAACGFVALALLVIIFIERPSGTRDQASHAIARTKTADTDIGAGAGSRRASSSRTARLINLATARGSEWDVIDAVEEIGTTLSGDEAKELVEAIRALASGAGADAMSAVDLNSVLNLLRRNGYLDREVLESLGAIVANKGANIETRDYALQHAEGWLRSRDRTTGAPLISDQESRQELHRLLLQSAAIREESFSGTAASAIVDLADFYPEQFDGQLIDETVLDLLRSEDVHPAARVTAIQLAAERGLVDTLPEIRMLTAGAATAPAMRLAGYGALGAIGDASDAAAIEELLATENRDPRYDAALKGALARITTRMTAASE